MTHNAQTQSVGRPRKKETIKEQSIYVYLPDKLMVEEWKSLAMENDQSISRFVMERVEDSLRKNGEGSRFSRKDLLDRVQQLEKENIEYKKEHDVKSRAYDAIEKEVQTLRVSPFLDPINKGFKQVGNDLVSLLRTRKRLGYDELLPALGIKPTEIELVKGVNNQIEVLVQYGLVQVDLRGWRWVD